MEYGEFFRLLTGHDAFPYQLKLGERPWPDLLEVPTGLGKTAAVMAAWLWKRLQQDPDTPRRLAYCLPMRVLVEQTRNCVEVWIGKAASEFGKRKSAVPQVNLLMGGETEDPWAEKPEAPAVIIGTQDMLLSRALMRGYGMSRYQWPIHFAMLHNDTFWVFDEVQLMGAGLPTSAQLEAFRRRLPLVKSCRSLWVSATLNRTWLDTVDLRPHWESLRQAGLGEQERSSGAVRTRREAIKRLHRAATMITTENQKQSAKQYAEALAAEIAQQHVAGTTTLVVVNTVERAQALLKALERRKVSADTLLVHSRYRPEERQVLNRRLAEAPAPDRPGRIIVATQAVEAGVDMTSRVLFTELAPWSSLVQRFGRCNRYGEAGPLGADIFWVDLDWDANDGKSDAKLTIPYDETALSLARGKLIGLTSASPADLPQVNEDAPLHPVIRAKDFRDLFHTDPDLSGFDVDISSYIRDADDLDVQVFWRDLAQGIEDQPLPHSLELCRASLSQAKALLDPKRKQQAYRFDSLDGKWRRQQGSLRPGLVLMLDLKAGGYHERLGLDPSVSAAVTAVTVAAPSGETQSYPGDRRSRVARPVLLHRHLADVAAVAAHLAAALQLAPQLGAALVTAASWHDAGKAHPVFQATLHDCDLAEAASRTPLLAKANSGRSHQRKHFRHELASMLAWLIHRSDHQDVDLIAYLIAAHHGKVRLSLRSMPEESEPIPPLGPRFARGVWENETLSGIDLGNGETIPPTALRLDLMELGEGAMGPSWTARTQRLLDRLGPFQLAWLETLLRLADWRASAAEQEEH